MPCPSGAIELGCCEEDVFISKRISHSFSVFTALGTGPIEAGPPPVAGFFLRVRGAGEWDTPFGTVVRRQESHINKFGTRIAPDGISFLPGSCPPHKWRDPTGGSGPSTFINGLEFTITSNTGREVEAVATIDGATVGGFNVWLEDEITLVDIDGMLRSRLEATQSPRNALRVGLGIACDGSTLEGLISSTMRPWGGLAVGCPLEQTSNSWHGAFGPVGGRVRAYSGLIQVAGGQVTFAASKYCKARTELNHPAAPCDPFFSRQPVHGPYSSCETIQANGPVTVPMPPLALGWSVFDDVWATDAPNDLRSFQLQPMPPCCNLLP